MIKLPDNKKCYSLPEQVAQNLLNIQYLAEQYKNIDALPAVWQTYKEEFDREIETFGDWTTTFEGWDNTLSTYLANMSSAAVSAIAGQDIAPKTVSQTNYSYEVEVNLNTTAGLTITNIYNRFCVINGVLYVIANFKIKNESGAAITIGNSYGYVASVSLGINSAIAGKIYDIDGYTVSQSNANGTLISSVPCLIHTGKIMGSATQFYSGRLSLLNNTGANTCSIQIALNGNASDRVVLADQDELFVTGRMALTIL